jgi:hypothetical protein
VLPHAPRQFPSWLFMLTLRDKIRIPLILAGILLVSFGVGIAYPHIKKNGFTFRYGAGRDTNLPAVIPIEAAPWTIVAGVGLLAAFYFTREK